ncbi:MAG: hypothetical protein AAF725_25635, partial [Acidobacteriota bacterium]
MMASRGFVKGPLEVRGFRVAGWYGAASVAVGEGGELEAWIERVTNPGSAVETVHWGRNYLYRAELESAGGPIGVVVKQFRNQGTKKRVERRLRGS